MRIQRKAILMFIPIELIEYHKNRKGSKNWDEYGEQLFNEIKQADDEKGISKLFIRR